jgi:hypothetical protein
MQVKTYFEAGRTVKRTEGEGGMGFSTNDLIREDLGCYICVERDIYEHLSMILLNSLCYTRSRDAMLPPVDVQLPCEQDELACRSAQP